MQLKNKFTLLQKIIFGATLLVPIIGYLLISSLLTTLPVDYEIKYETKTYTVYHVEADNLLFIADDFGNIEWTIGQVVYNRSVQKYGIELEVDDTIRINKDNMKVKVIDGRLEIAEMTKQDLAQYQDSSLGATFFISLLGIAIIVLIVSGKMNLQKSHPVLATLLALAAGTVVLLIINVVVSGLVDVFVIFTLSWLGFTLEYYYFKMKGKSNAEQERYFRKIQELDDAIEETKRLAGL